MDSRPYRLTPQELRYQRSERAAFTSFVVDPRCAGRRRGRVIIDATDSQVRRCGVSTESKPGDGSQGRGVKGGLAEVDLRDPGFC